VEAIKRDNVLLVLARVPAAHNAFGRMWASMEVLGDQFGHIRVIAQKTISEQGIATV
jgi:hypothetical protein